MKFEFQNFQNLEVSLAGILKVIDGELWNVNLGLMQRLTQKVHFHESSDIEFSEMPNLEVSVWTLAPNIDEFTWWALRFIYFIENCKGSRKKNPDIYGQADRKGRTPPLRSAVLWLFRRDAFDFGLWLYMSWNKFWPRKSFLTHWLTLWLSEDEHFK